MTLTSNYKLINTRPAAPLGSIVPYDVKVFDTRLQGLDVSPKFMISDLPQARSKVVSYDWNGTLPDMEELNELAVGQHPGEGTPDTHASAYIGVGTAACGIGVLGLLVYGNKRQQS